MSSPTPKPDPIADIANALMRAVAHSGIMRGHDDYHVATRIMREELENFLISSSHRHHPLLLRLRLALALRRRCRAIICAAAEMSHATGASDTQTLPCPSESSSKSDAPPPSYSQYCEIE
jgi:hypothetical protein